MKEMLYYVKPQDEAVELEYQQQCTITLDVIFLLLILKLEYYPRNVH